MERVVHDREAVYAYYSSTHCACVHGLIYVSGARVVQHLLRPNPGYAADRGYKCSTHPIHTTHILVGHIP